MITLDDIDTAKSIAELSNRLNDARSMVLARVRNAHAKGDRGEREVLLTWAQTLGISAAEVARALGVTRQRAHQLMPR